MNKNLLVSVCMITYNHAPFISQAIEGVIMQETDFQYEIIIGEDFSTDETRKICREYEAKFPEKIKLLERAHNLGMMGNFIDTLQKCKGDYIAICEGDDYWTDPLKLKKQIEFLEANRGFTICHHPVDYLSENNVLTPGKLDTKERVSTFEDLAVHNHIYTASCVFRNGFIKEFPKWFYTSTIGDYVLHLLNAEHGKIKLLNEIMAVYRIHNQGVWSSETEEKNTIKMISVVEKCRAHFFPKGDKEFKQQLLKYYEFLCFSSFEKSACQEYNKYYRKVLRLIKYVSIRALIALTVRRLLCLFPGFIPLYQKIVKKS